MKGLIIGTDLLEYNDEIKVIELNTNIGLQNKVISHIDITPFFDKLIESGITELHFIYTRGYGGETYVDNEELDLFTLLLKTNCELNNIQFTTYPVQQNTMVVPDIEDSDTKFILRHSYDDTALVDSLYCADKYEFIDLIKNETYAIKSYTPSIDTLDEFYNSPHPNLVIKSRYPRYDSNIYPELYNIEVTQSLDDLKNNLQENTLIQEFIFDEKNVVENRISVIRSVDILFGSSIDPINIGVYRTTSLIDIDFSPNEFIPNTQKYNKKTRFKYINKKLGDNMIAYYVDDDSLILKSDKTKTTINDITIGDNLFSVDFFDKNGVSPSDENFRKVIVKNEWDSTLSYDNSTLTSLSSSVEIIKTETYDTLFIKITLSNGEYWNDSITAEYYIEDPNTQKTKWVYVNELNIGDNLITFDTNTEVLTSIEIIGLEVVFDTKKIYMIDVEPSDIFLVDVGNSKMAIMHNVDCFNCFGQFSCGTFGCDLNCVICGGGKF